MAPITAVQFGVTGGLTKVIAQDGKRPLSHAEKLGIAGVAGCTSALISCPADLVIIHQQQTGFSLPRQIRTINAEFGKLKFYKGGVLFAAVFPASLL